ncbi:hypothetical protein SteCoe_25202 [Stentor coeruleus]|uniref:Uncharacterized protein n=1 Tax=Stentor coeruleus TaxID=5963 RepID=A0A1R2BFR0_9CILI|nr:hypothetical protein SteCoe_25202 [Stentor coeruleus]
MNIFGKKEDNLIDERMRLTKLYLDQQKEENSELRRDYNNLKELALRNKLMLDDLLKSVSANEKLIKSIRDQNQALESIISTNDELILKLEDEINQLRGVKNTLIPTDFYLGNTQNEGVQEILDKISSDEILCFRDANGELWQIGRKDHIDEENECSASKIDEINISINL